MSLHTGNGVDIYILADGIEFENDEIKGRAFNGGFRSQQCNWLGTQLASLAAGKYVGVAKNANVYRYIARHRS